MAELEKCWACAGAMWDEDGRLIRAKKAECEWVVKRVCAGCWKLVVLFPDRIVQVDGEFWTLRAYDLVPKG